MFFLDAKEFSQNTAEKTRTFHQNYTHSRISVQHFLLQEQPTIISATATKTKTNLEGKIIAVNNPAPNAAQATPDLLPFLTDNPPLFCFGNFRDNSRHSQSIPRQKKGVNLLKKSITKRPRRKRATHLPPSQRC